MERKVKKDSGRRRESKKKSSVNRLTVVCIGIACMSVMGLLGYAGLSSQANEVTLYATESSEALVVRGSVFAECDAGIEGQVSKLTFAVAIPDGGSPVNFTEPPDNVVTVSYIDTYQRVDGLPFQCEEYVPGDGDAMLEPGETFLLTVGADNSNGAGLLPQILSHGLGAAAAFTVEVITPDGEVLSIARTTPDTLDTVMNLF